MFIEIAHAATEAVVHETAETGLLGTFGIDLKLFLAQLINFSIVIFVLSKWVFKPLVKTMDQRKQIVEKGLNDAKSAEEALRLAKESESLIIKEARSQAKILIDEGKERGEYEKQARIQKSNEIIAQQLKDSKEQAVRIVEEERAQARNELASLIGEATEKISRKTIDAGAHRTLIDRAISDLEKQHG